MSGMRSLPGLGGCVLWCLACVLWSPACAAVVAQEPSQDPSLCELKVQGQSIKSLTLIKEGGPALYSADGFAGQKYDRPGEALWLAPGRYRVSHVELDGGVESQQFFEREQDWFEVARGENEPLVIGAPLLPSVSVKRHGRHLQMDYLLVDGAGRNYSQVIDFENYAATPKFPAPRFSVFCDGELLGSEAFQYG